MVWGIAGAIEKEVRCIIENLSEDSVSQWGKRLVHTGKIKNQDVVVMATGIGKVKSAASIQYILDHFPVESVIFTGMAGAVNPDVKTGDIVISQKVVEHDFDLDGKGIVDGMKIPWLEANPGLIDLAVRANYELGFAEKFYLGKILTGDQAIIDSKKRKWLWDTFHGDCVEMEGAAVASVCFQNGLPFVIIRAISDLADEYTRNDFRRTMPKACKDAANIVLTMLEL
jgi:adenosylhomocysteine nucleosidase